MTDTELGRALRRAVRGEVRTDPAGRHLYASDASNYRHLPRAVVCPRDGDDIAAVLAVCREAGVGVTLRGAGTSLAGQACGPGVVVDVSRHLRHHLEIDPDRRTATVDAGVVLARVVAAAAPYGLTVGPDPSTANRCTVGGMVGNDACGVHTLRWGRTADNVEALEVLLADGTRTWIGHRPDPSWPPPLRRTADVLSALGRHHADAIRRRFPPIPRRVSGYGLDALLDGPDLVRALVGTEGTCAVVLRVRLRLVDRPPHRQLVVLGYPDLVTAAEALPALLTHRPDGLEAIDRAVVAGLRGALTRDATELLPAGEGWLLVEVTGASPAECAARAAAIRRDAGTAAAVTLTDPAAQERLWEVRRAGLGATTLPAEGRPRRPGWEDAAVPPERVADYLRGLGEILGSEGLSCATYGHFGDGCVHTRIDFDLTSRQGTARFRRVVEAAADLTVSLGGSLSGEHGDGQARSELLGRMFGAELLEAFRAFKAAWDPEGLLNPGIVVDPRPLDRDLRWQPPLRDPPTVWRFDRGLAFEAARCVGVGLCVRDDGRATMCPSWRATRDEQHSTRGRARLLFELLRRDSTLAGWQDRGVRDALELCLSCKACKAECPVGVDVAAYKAEFLHHHHRRRPRPPSAYALGLLPRWLRLAGRSPRLADTVARSRTLRRLAGITTDRPAPRLAAEPFHRWWRRAGHRLVPAEGPRAVLFVDTFTDRFDPGVGIAAVRLLTAAGWRVEVPDRWLCCGRPLYDVGMLTTARRWLRRVVEALGEDDAPVVVCEPSCLAALRDELVALVDDPRAAAVARRAVPVAALLTDPPPLRGRVALLPHCQQAAVVGVSAERALLARAGAEVTVLDVGCCGLAGGFGYTAGIKAALSRRIAADRLLPAVAELDAETILVADGWSCRTQLAQLADRRAVHHAALLAAALEGGSPPARVER